MRLLVTGATGKLGQAVLDRLLAETAWAHCEIVALCHNRRVTESDRVTVVSGSLADAAIIDKAMAGVTHVLHMAAVKESPELAVDVSIKGMFLLLEAARQSPTLEQFILIGGDCSVGHIFVDYPDPITETAPRMAYPGCYAMTKVVEEVMLEQAQIQYGINGCILRAPWIMEKDDFRFALSFGPDQFGGPAWDSLLPAEAVQDHHRHDRVPLMRDGTGAPLKRSFIHIDDLVSAILSALDNDAAYQQLFNIAMDEPVDYAKVAAYLQRTRGREAVDVPTTFFSNWLDNAKARHVLGWRPEIGLETLIERAFAYQRAPDDPRKIWYPG